MNVNDLLTWLSARGAGTWSRYRAAVDELQLADHENSSEEDLAENVPDGKSLPLHLRLRLNLERLGHAEFFRKDFPSGWRVVPPTLACNDHDGGVVGILCGARSDELMARIRAAARIDRLEIREQLECPDRVLIGSNNHSRMKDLAQRVGIRLQWDAAQALLASLPAVDDWQMRRRAELPFGSDWEVDRFSTSTLGWRDASADEARAASLGLYRFRTRRMPEYYLMMKGNSYRVSVQVGKYMMLNSKRRRHLVSYMAASKILSMPISCRPPPLIDRALTLSSGLIPGIENGQLRYQGVSPEVAITSTALLKQQSL